MEQQPITVKQFAEEFYRKADSADPRFHPYRQMADELSAKYKDGITDQQLWGELSTGKWSQAVTSAYRIVPDAIPPQVAPQAGAPGTSDDILSAAKRGAWKGLAAIPGWLAGASEAVEPFTIGQTQGQSTKLLQDWQKAAEAKAAEYPKPSGIPATVAAAVPEAIGTIAPYLIPIPGMRELRAARVGSRLLGPALDAARMALTEGVRALPAGPVEALKSAGSGALMGGVGFPVAHKVIGPVTRRLIPWGPAARFTDVALPVGGFAAAGGMSPEEATAEGIAFGLLATPGGKPKRVRTSPPPPPAQIESASTPAVSAFRPGDTAQMRQTLVDIGEKVKPLQSSRDQISKGLVGNQKLIDKQSKTVLSMERGGAPPNKERYALAKKTLENLRSHRTLLETQLRDVDAQMSPWSKAQQEIIDHLGRVEAQGAQERVAPYPPERQLVAPGVQQPLPTTAPPPEPPSVALELGYTTWRDRYFKRGVSGWEAPNDGIYTDERLHQMYAESSGGQPTGVSGRPIAPLVVTPSTASPLTSQSIRSMLEIETDPAKLDALVGQLRAMGLEPPPLAEFPGAAATPPPQVIPPSEAGPLAEAARQDIELQQGEMFPGVLMPGPRTAPPPTPPEGMQVPPPAPAPEPAPAKPTRLRGPGGRFARQQAAEPQAPPPPPPAPIEPESAGRNPVEPPAPVSDVDAAKARLSAKFSALKKGLGSQTGAFTWNPPARMQGMPGWKLEVQDFRDLHTIGRDLYQQVKGDFDAWRQQMVEGLGDWVEENLKPIWDNITAQMGPKTAPPPLPPVGAIRPGAGPVPPGAPARSAGQALPPAQPRPGWKWVRTPEGEMEAVPAEGQEAPQWENLRTERSAAPPPPPPPPAPREPPPIQGPELPPERLGIVERIPQDSWKKYPSLTGELALARDRASDLVNEIRALREANGTSMSLGEWLSMLNQAQEAEYRVAIERAVARGQEAQPGAPSSAAAPPPPPAGLSTYFGKSSKQAEKAARWAELQEMGRTFGPFIEEQFDIPRMLEQRKGVEVSNENLREAEAENRFRAGLVPESAAPRTEPPPVPAAAGVNIPFEGVPRLRGSGPQEPPKDIPSTSPPPPSVSPEYEWPMGTRGTTEAETPTDASPVEIKLAREALRAAGFKPRNVVQKGRSGILRELPSGEDAAGVFFKPVEDGTIEVQWFPLTNEFAATKHYGIPGKYEPRQYTPEVADIQRRTSAYVKRAEQRVQEWEKNPTEANRALADSALWFANTARAALVGARKGPGGVAFPGRTVGDTRTVWGKGVTELLGYLNAAERESPLRPGQMASPSHGAAPEQVQLITAQPRSVEPTPLQSRIAAGEHFEQSTRSAQSPVEVLSVATEAAKRAKTPPPPVDPGLFKALAEEAAQLPPKERKALRDKVSALLRAEADPDFTGQKKLTKMLRFPSEAHPPGPERLAEDIKALSGGTPADAAKAAETVANIILQARGQGTVPEAAKKTVRATQTAKPPEAPKTARERLGKEAKLDESAYEMEAIGEGNWIVATKGGEWTNLFVRKPERSKFYTVYVENTPMRMAETLTGAKMEALKLAAETKAVGRGRPRSEAPPRVQIAAPPEAPGELTDAQKIAENNRKIAEMQRLLEERDAEQTIEENQAKIAELERRMKEGGVGERRD